MTDAGRIAARDLVVEFRGRREGTVRAVDVVDLDVEPGEVFCIAGESGCGKTTLGRAILGLVRPTSGSVTIGGIDPSEARGRDLKALRRNAQMIFQDPMGSLNPRHTIYEIVAEPIRIHGVPGDERALVAEALSHVGLRPAERFFLSYPHELSGGQRQRVVVAAALVLQPKILIADEPVSMLDASVRGEILRLLVDLKRELDMTLVVITHDLGVAWSMATRVGVMYLGRMVEAGTVDRVLLDPAHPYTRALVEVAPEIGVRRRQQVLLGEPPDAGVIPSGCRFHPRCPRLKAGLPAAVEVRCREEDLTMVEIEPAHSVACHPAISRIQHR